MDKGHHMQSFMLFFRQIVMAVKVIENDKIGLIDSCQDFNLADCFKALLFQKKDKLIGVKHAEGGFNEQLGDRAGGAMLCDLELNASLLSLPGQMITGDSQGCKLFCSLFASDNKSVNFEDFIKSFLPINLEKAKKLLKRKA